MYCIGIDGGGSKTLAYLAEMNGRIIDRRFFGPSNYQIIGKESALSVFNEIFTYFIGKNNISESDIRFISAGIAGLDRKEDKLILESIFDSMNLSCDIILNNDSYTSLSGGLNNKDGIILSVGTGSVALGKQNASYHRVGGWTHILGDEGSGYSIGLNALKSVMKIYDGRFNPSELYYEILDYIDVEDPRDTITYAYKNIHDTKKISGITPLVFKHFLSKDLLAIKLINAAVDDLYQLVNPLLSKLYSEDESLSFTYSGSIILECNYIKDNLIKKLQEKYPKINPVDPIYNSAVGALIIGWSKYKVDYKENLRKSYKA